MKPARTAVVIATCLFAGCSSSSRIEAPAPETLAEFTPEVEVRELWTADVGSLAGPYDALLTPVLDDKVIYVSNVDGDVRALAADSGRLLWETDLDLPVTGAAAVGDGLVVVGTRKGEVVALDEKDGKRLWSGKASSEVQAPAAIGHGMVVVQAVDGKISGLSSKDGKRLWVFDRAEPALSLHGTATPLIATDTVLTGFGNGKIVALQLTDGKLLWERTVAQPRGRNEIERLIDVDAPLLLWGETLFTVAYQGRIIAMDMRTGREQWSRELSSYVGMDADRGAVLLADDKGRVLAFDHGSGASLWRQEKLRGRGLSAPVLQEKTVVVGDYEGYVHWLSRDDGRMLARYRVDSVAVRARGIADGSKLYVAAQSGRLAALQLMPRP